MPGNSHGSSVEWVKLSSSSSTSRSRPTVRERSVSLSIWRIGVDEAPEVVVLDGAVADAVGEHRHVEDDRMLDHGVQGVGYAARAERRAEVLIPDVDHGLLGGGERVRGHRRAATPATAGRRSLASLGLVASLPKPPFGDWRTSQWRPADVTTAGFSSEAGEIG